MDTFFWNAAGQRFLLPDRPLEPPERAAEEDWAEFWEKDIPWETENENEKVCESEP